MKQYVALLTIAALGVSGCTSTGSASGKRPMTDMETGAIIGAAGGAGSVRSHTRRTVPRALSSARWAVGWPVARWVPIWTARRRISKRT